MAAARSPTPVSRERVRIVKARLPKGQRADAIPLNAAGSISSKRSTRLWP